MKKKLELLKDAIRREIPELMKLKKGCLVIHYNEFYDNYTIIGAEPQLNDVLRWANKNDISYQENGKNLELYCYSKSVKCFEIWDLSKPYLKDQSEELINFLIEFI